MKMRQCGGVQGHFGHSPDYHHRHHMTPGELSSLGLTFLHGPRSSEEAGHATTLHKVCTAVRVAVGSEPTAERLWGHLSNPLLSYRKGSGGPCPSFRVQVSVSIRDSNMQRTGTFGEHPARVLPMLRQGAGEQMVLSKVTTGQSGMTETIPQAVLSPFSGDSFGLCTTVSL